MPPHTGLRLNGKQSLLPPMPKVSAKITPNMISETLNRGFGSFQIEFPSLRPKRNNFRVSARGIRPAGKSAQKPRFAFPAASSSTQLCKPNARCKCLIYKNFAIFKEANSLAPAMPATQARTNRLRQFDCLGGSQAPDALTAHKSGMGFSSRQISIVC